MLKELLSGPKRLHMVASRLKQTLQTLSHRLIVIHHKYCPSFAHHILPCLDRGSTTRNVTPLSGLLPTEISPRCASTMERQITNPIPKPSDFVVKNGSNIRPSRSPGTPGPESRTRIATRSLSTISVLIVNFLMRTS